MKKTILAIGLIMSLVACNKVEEKSSTAVSDYTLQCEKAHKANEKELKKLELDKKLRHKEITQEEYNYAISLL